MQINPIAKNTTAENMEKYLCPQIGCFLNRVKVPEGKKGKRGPTHTSLRQKQPAFPVEQHFLSFNLTELISLRLRKSLALFPDQINTGNSSANPPVIRMALCNLEGRRQRKSQKIKDIILALLRSILWTAAVI